MRDLPQLGVTRGDRLHTSVSFSLYSQTSLGPFHLKSPLGGGGGGGGGGPLNWLSSELGVLLQAARGFLSQKKKKTA